MRITHHPLRGPAATAAVRNSQVFDRGLRVHLRFVRMDDAPFLCAIDPGPSLPARRSWLQRYMSREAEGREFYFVIVENGRDRGLVRMNDFTVIGDEPSFGWGDFLAQRPGLFTAVTLAIYSLGFDTLGYARAHTTVPRVRPDLSAFHLDTGAELEIDDGDYRQFRFDTTTFDQVRSDAARRRTVTATEIA